MLVRYECEVDLSKPEKGGKEKKWKIKAGNLSLFREEIIEVCLHQVDNVNLMNQEFVDSRAG